MYGVDVLTLSIRKEDLPLYEDPIAIAIFFAMEKGTFVSTSARNDGPTPQSMHNGIPWVIIVATSTLNREFHGTLTLGNGASIIVAWPNVLVSNIGQCAFSNFNFLSGTSMASAHVASVTALVKGTHPDWSPVAIRSIIMTTSYILDNTKGPIKEIGDDGGYKPSSSLAFGAGHANPNEALNPGLVYDVGAQA
ncbi:hypothetical protein RJT34_15726 [Clitoria ternatea]|uniref:Peptidase S8/S53 domain-containing protein n=1 Tax=Clitoria ternatea TaxID=43366 RepID=A0AAN9J750_CLITE